MTSSGHLLTIDNLSVHIPASGGTVRAVDGVSLTLAPGRTLAIVGESGCGKSMLCRAIMGIAPAASTVGGRIEFGGRDLTSLPEKELNRIRGRRIGIILQDPMSSLNPVMRIGIQIQEQIRHHLRPPLAEARQRAISLLESVGIPRPVERFDCYPHELSGGMRQRVAIAMAISCDPDLIIADEPTTALDVTVQAEILNLLGRLQKERNMGIVLVTHDLAVVAGRAHYTAVMYAGRIVERAPTAELFGRVRMPYTKALLDSVPSLDDPPGKPLKSIGGQPSAPSAKPEGCRFAPRCPRSEQCCHENEPPLQADAGKPDHLYACWFPCR